MIEKILKKYSNDPEYIMNALHDIQDTKKDHYISFDEMQAVAKYFKVPLSRVNGVATFYTMYSKEPRGKYIIRICESAPCHVNGALNIINSFKKELGLTAIGETTKDRLFTIETTSCLGVCGVAPACMINDAVYGNLTEKKISGILKEIKAEELKGGKNV